VFGYQQTVEVINKNAYLPRHSLREPIIRLNL